MFHLRGLTGFSVHLECWNAFRDLVNRISSETNVIVGTSKFEYSEGPPGDVLRTSWGRPESTCQERPLNVRLGCSQDVRWRSPQDGQIGFLGDVLATLEGDIFGKSLGPIFAGWVTITLDSIRLFVTVKVAAEVG